MVLTHAKQELTPKQAELLEAMRGVIAEEVGTLGLVGYMQVGELVSALGEGRNVAIGPNGPKREATAAAKRLTKNGLPVLTGTSTDGAWRWYWVHLEALEARHATDPEEMKRLVFDLDCKRGYSTSKGSRKLYGDYHSVRDALIANGNCPTELWLELLHKNRSFDDVIVAELERRESEGDLVAGLGLMLWRDDPEARQGPFADLMSSIEGVLAAG